MIMDESKALLLAAVRSFTSCATLNDYINQSMNVLIHGFTAPAVYIRQKFAQNKRI